MLNSVILIGRIGQELTLKTTPNGTEVVSFSLAVQRNYNKEVTDWITIVAWRGTASLIAKYFNKGNMICIEGNIQTRNYDDKDGKKVYITEVVAEKVHFVNEKREPNTSTATSTNSFAENTTNTNAFASNIDDDFVPVEVEDLPFGI